MIKLTTECGDVLYFPPKEIKTIIGHTSEETRVITDNDEWLVKETPEEIMRLMNE